MSGSWQKPNFGNIRFILFLEYINECTLESFRLEKGEDGRRGKKRPVNNDDPFDNDSKAAKIMVNLKSVCIG